jgi:hypothetical protein
MSDRAVVVLIGVAAYSNRMGERTFKTGIKSDTNVLLTLDLKLPYHLKRDRYYARQSIYALNLP